VNVFDENLFRPVKFSGSARLFPLPNHVMFPGVVQPLHIFESRYREMVEDALAGDGCITMVMLESGWEPDYHGRPRVVPVGCLGRIAAHVRQEDGQFNLLLAGLQRVRIVRELPPRYSFREAEVEPLDDDYPAMGDAARPSVHRRLLERFRALAGGQLTVQPHLSELFQTGTPLGTLADVIAFTMNMPAEMKQELLAELDVDRRAQRLLDQLGQLGGGQSESPSVEFPPEFSSN